MTKTYSLLQLFSIIDGRLSTSIRDVYDILNHICDDSLMTHDLPVAMNYLKFKNPNWYQEQTKRIKTIKCSLCSNTFETIIGAIKDIYNENIEIPQLKDEFDTSDFSKFMCDNSLLLKL